MMPEIYIDAPILPGKPAAWNLPRLRAAVLEHADAEEIRLKIHSDGGDILEGFAMFDFLTHHPARIVAEIRILAASMAGVLAMAADEIAIAENGFLVLHNPWNAPGPSESADLRLYADLLDHYKAAAIAAYRRHSPLSPAEISALMDAPETWLDASSALELGFAHRVLSAVDPAPMANRLDLTRYRRMPASARAQLRTPSPMKDPEKERPDDPQPREPQTPKEKEETPPPGEAPAEETTLLERLARMLRRDEPERAEPEDERAQLAREMRASRRERAAATVERALAPHLATVEPADLDGLRALMLERKTAELEGDEAAGRQYAQLAALLPRLASPKAGGALAASDDAALEAEGAAEISAARLDVDRRYGISEERRAELMKKYPGARPGNA